MPLSNSHEGDCVDGIVKEDHPIDEQQSLVAMSCKRGRMPANVAKMADGHR